jgi:hypothetical protein
MATLEAGDRRACERAPDAVDEALVEVQRRQGSLERGDVGATGSCRRGQSECGGEYQDGPAG